MALTMRQRVGLELQRQLRRTQEQLHPLRSLFWECTLRCNMNCRHCGSDCTAVPGVKDMPAEDFLRVIDALTPHVDPHKTFIIITGGEALLRNDLEEVGTALYERGYPWGVVSNGYLVDRQRLESLVAAGMHSMSISLDGGEADHNWIRRNRLSHARAEAAIGLLAERRDVLWDVVTCVNGHNIGSLAAFKEHLVEMGVRRWRLFSIFPMGRAAGDESLQVSDEQYRWLIDFIAESRRTDGRIDVSYACEGFLGDYEGRARSHYFYCRAGVEVASIRCDGSIGGCTSIRSNMSQGNIYAGDDLWETWQNRFENMRNRSWAKKGRCASCEVWRYCEGSGLHLYDEEGELLTCHYERLTKKDLAR